MPIRIAVEGRVDRARLIADMKKKKDHHKPAQKPKEPEDDEAEEGAVAEKSKDPFADMPKGTFVMDNFKHPPNELFPSPQSPEVVSPLSPEIVEQQMLDGTQPRTNKDFSVDKTALSTIPSLRPFSFSVQSTQPDE
ncbi:hypothetical protein NECAME_12785 [Necator americanus]|uniref:Uncharacterized protein n=1 Tax=Necator americanus TaxID=51031 RepID=W2T162_NECAM|nr:hypothetical protein NECAME_12785 [Necator americanus]ETN74717.1 hypothetical protein NECAME_12785 [Necator americanus]